MENSPSMFNSHSSLQKKSKLGYNIIVINNLKSTILLPRLGEGEFTIKVFTPTVHSPQKNKLGSDVGVCSVQRADDSDSRMADSLLPSASSHRHHVQTQVQTVSRRWESTCWLSLASTKGFRGFCYTQLDNLQTVFFSLPGSSSSSSLLMPVSHYRGSPEDPPGVRAWTRGILWGSL